MRPISLPSLLLAVSLSGLPGPGPAAEPTPSPASAFDIFGKDFLKKQGIQPALDRGDARQAAHLVASYFRKRKEPRYFSWADARPARPAKPGADPAADGILQNRFVIRPNQAPVPLSKPLDWKAPQTAGRKLDDLELGVLNGGQWVDTLSEGWWRTYDKRYVEGCLKLLKSWRAQSPLPPKAAGDGTPLDPGYAPLGYPAYQGINVGGRVVNWINAFYRMRDCEALSDEDLLFLLTLLHESAGRLADVAELCRNDGRHLSNHLTISYRGLFYIALLFPELREAESWKGIATERLEDQIRKAVLDDGFQWERSPGYHANCLRDYLTIHRLATLNRAPFSAVFQARIERMYDCILKLEYPNKTMPLLNDSSGGYYGPTELGLGACLYKRPDFKFAATSSLDLSAEAVGGITAEERKAYEALKPRVPDVLSTALAASGHYVMRTGWTPQDKYLLLDQGAFSGWHSHADQLSVDVYAYGRSLVVDPGSCHYASPAHAFLQSAAAHNVVVGPEGGAGMETPARILVWRTGPRADAIRGEVVLPGGLQWRRTVVFVKPDYWLVSDEIRPAGKESCEAAQLWHPMPGGMKEAKDRILLVRPPAADAAGNLLLQWPAGSAPRVARRRGFVSAGAAGTATVDKDKKAEAEYIALERNGKGPLAFDTLLYPYRGEKPPEAEILSERAGGATGIRVKRKGVEEILLLGDGKEPVRLWGYDFDGTLALVRLSGGKPEWVFLEGGTRFKAPGGLAAASEKPFEGARLAVKQGRLEPEKP